MKPHSWSDESPALRAGDSGTSIRCSGCEKEIFFPSHFTDGAKRFAKLLAWTQNLPPGWKERDASLPPHPEIGYHAILAEDCDEAKMIPMIEIMYG